MITIESIRRMGVIETETKNALKAAGKAFGIIKYKKRHIKAERAPTRITNRSSNNWLKLNGFSMRRKPAGKRKPIPHERW